MSLADIKRTWLLKQLGISSSNLTEADLLTQLYGLPSVGLRSDMFMSYQSGQFYVFPHSSSTTALAAANALKGGVFVAPRDMSVDALAMEITVAGTAGSVVRLGIYSDHDDDNDMDLVVDAGTIDGTVVGVATKTFTPVALEAGKRYVLVAVTQGAPATEPTIRHTGGSPFMFGGTAALVVPNTISGIQVNAVAGALPATLTKSYTTSPMRIAFRTV